MDCSTGTAGLLSSARPWRRCTISRWSCIPRPSCVLCSGSSATEFRQRGLLPPADQRYRQVLRCGGGHRWRGLRGPLREHQHEPRAQYSETDSSGYWLDVTGQWRPLPPATTLFVGTPTRLPDLAVPEQISKALGKILKSRSRRV